MIDNIYKQWTATHNTYSTRLVCGEVYEEVVVFEKKMLDLVKVFWKFVVLV